MNRLGGPPTLYIIVTIRDTRNYIRALVYSYYTTITGWEVLLMNRLKFNPRPLILGHPPNMKYCRSTMIYHIVGVFNIRRGGGVELILGGGD